MPIATVTTVLTVTPVDEIQIVHGENDYELIDDPTPFRMRVSEIVRENDEIIGVFGPVIEGPSRYTGMIATLLTRLDGSKWETDSHTQANFKVGKTPARRVFDFPHYHPHGTKVDGYPFIVRFADVDVTK